MKTKIIISAILGLLITIATSLIPFGFYNTQIGPYYSTGFPLKFYQMFGDAGVMNKYAFLGNLIIWFIVMFTVLIIIAKLRNRKI